MSFIGTVLAGSTLLLAASAFAAWSLREKSASTRHALWAISMGGLLLWPLAEGLLPKVKLPVLPPLAVSVEEPAVEVAATVSPIAAPGVMGSSAMTVSPTFPLSVPGRSEALETPVPMDTPPSPGSWTPRDGLVALWALGALIVVSRLLIGTWSVGRLWSRARVVAGEDWRTLLEGLRSRMAVPGTVEIRISDEPIPPMTLGVLGRAILLPRDAPAWSHARRLAVLAHELAHVRRRDGLTQILVQLVQGLYWFHPLAWYAIRRLADERERAADDRVLALDARRGDYAEHLVAVTRSIGSGVSLATLTMAEPSRLETRLLAILDPKTPRQAVSRFAVAFLALAVLLLTLPAATFRLTAMARIPEASEAGVSLGAPQGLPDGFGRIETRMLRADSATPVSGVQVRVISVVDFSQVAEASSDSNGRVILQVPRPGDYAVNASRDGMLPLGRAGLTPASRRVTVGEGETADAGVFLFEPAGIIGGRVLDAEGVAAAGIYVEALTLAYEFPGLRRWKRVGFGNSATTDAEGRFRLPWLPEGEFYLRAVDQGTQDAQLVTYFPGTAEASAATAVLVYAGRESVAEFRMTEAGSHRLEGQLFADLPGVSGLPGASLYLIPRADGSPLVEDPRAFLRSELQPGSDGRFSVGGLSSGRYDLIALAEDESGLETGITARTLVEIGDASLADVPLILRAGETVEGSLRAAGAEGAVELVPSRGGVGGIPRGESRTRVRVELVPSEDSPTGEIRPDLLSDTDFRFSDVPRGRYRVRARLMGAGAGERAYIADILANGRSVLGDDLVVAGEGVELAVIVGNDGSALRVRFRDAAGDPVQIAVVPDSLPAADRTPTSSRLVFDPDRGTRIANLGPGRYRLYAWHNPLREPALFPVSDPQFLRQYQSQSVSVVLGANSELDVEVPLARLIE